MYHNARHDNSAKVEWIFVLWNNLIIVDRNAPALLNGYESDDSGNAPVVNGNYNLKTFSPQNLYESDSDVVVEDEGKSLLFWGSSVVSKLTYFKTLS